MKKKNKYNIRSNSGFIIDPITVVAAIIMINIITGINTAINMYNNITEFNFSEYSLYLIFIVLEFSFAIIFSVFARFPPFVKVLII